MCRERKGGRAKVMGGLNRCIGVELLGSVCGYSTDWGWLRIRDFRV
jgi:hypothetical protein